MVRKLIDRFNTFLVKRKRIPRMHFVSPGSAGYLRDHFVVSQLHMTGACSSVMMSSIPSDYHFQSWGGREKGRETFMKTVAHRFFCTRLSGTSTMVDNAYRPCDLSFIVVSLSQGQLMAGEFFEELGFTRLKKNYNVKNNTSPFLMAVATDDLRKKLKELGFGEDGLDEESRALYAKEKEKK